jgi:hypothetical protein
MKKVASYLSLWNIDEQMFRLWLQTLPVLIREKQIKFLLLKSEYRKAVLWTSNGGFRFFNYEND